MIFRKGRLFGQCVALLALVLLASGSALEQRSPQEVTLALLGDVMLGRGVHPAEDSLVYLQPWLSSADLALANLESPLSERVLGSSTAYDLCAPAASLSTLASSGLDLLSLANNHRDDCQPDGAAHTSAILARAGFGSLGPSTEPVYREVNSLPLAFLAFDATGEFDAGLASEAVRTARASGGIVIVSVHWGAEYQAGASERQVELAQQLSEAGASLIWGHHPHVLQSARWINAGKTLVIYSLGNALFDQAAMQDTRRSALIWVKLGPHGVDRFEAIPFVIDVRNSRVEAPDADQVRQIMQYFTQ